MNPSELASDSVFLRRAYLDLLGILPTAAEARAFVADPRGDKRSRLVDALLARPEFADHWALKWSDLLKNEERTLDRKGVQNFHHWIRRNIEQNVPLDRFVRELVAARGSTYSQPAANYYRANRDAITRAETTAQLFLGVRLQCAKCHNHPFDRWTQNDYYSWASFFAPVDYKVLENNRRDKNDKHEFDGEQIVTREGKEIVRDPKTGESMPPRFLGEPHYEQGTEDQLDHLAGWLTHQENPLFAKAQVNRIWYNLLGRGLVDPIDDFRATNPPSIPPLLDALAEDFVRHGFDLRHTIRTIMNSRTYQLSPVPNESNADDELNFSRAVVRRLTAEQLLDSLCQVADVPARFNGYPLGLRSGQIPGVRAVRPRDQRPSNGDEFLQLFGKPPRLLSCECERSMETTLGQTVQLISGQTINELLVRPENRLGRMLLSGRTDAELVEELYWTALSRPPSETELARFASHLAASPDRRKALEDAAWALVNAKEFVLRQ